MELHLQNRFFIVGGATAGFGGAVANTLLREGANILAIARNSDKLTELKSHYPKQVEILAADITLPETKFHILEIVGDRYLDGALVNAGGPPAKSFLDTNLDDWDAAYKNILRWKVDLTQSLMPKLREQKYGRLVFVESISVKQPVENLVLSNSLRPAVVGFVKTLSQEVARDGITLNILSPGYHNTEAVKRVIKKKSEVTGMDYQVVEQQLIKNIPVGRMGEPEEFASIAVWLLSPLSGYITGQTISVDGGVMLGIFG